MTNRERGEQIADEQLATWPTDVQPVLRLGIRNDLMVPAITRALDEATGEAQDDELGAILTILLSQESVYFDSNALPIDVLHRLQELVRLRRDAIRARGNK